MKRKKTTVEMFGQDRRNNNKYRLRLKLKPLVIALWLTGSVASANPDTPTVIAGNASFDQIGNQLSITNSPGTIINWRGFSIDRNEITRFLQQSDQSAVLNRVMGTSISNLMGELNSNGRVFLVNPNGVVIGDGARIDTAGFVASTLGITDDDFLQGNYQFKGDSGAIINNGTITTGPGGEVVLIAPTIENGGDITVAEGEIILAAGREVTLTSLDDADISFRVSAPENRALNLGTLTAQNGAIGVFAGQIKNEGTISANRISTNARGQIVLQADSQTEISGTISATGEDNPGGEITILGDDITLTSATLDATGTNGGTVLVGGEFQGRGELQRARNTKIDDASVIYANALERGNGGEIIVWSEQSTESFGLLTARGGSISGDGGLIETSSRGNLEFGQPADVSATQGAAGTWLLDPEDIVIDSGKADSISTALNGGSNVQIKTADSGSGEGNITVASAIRKTEGPDAALGLIAHSKINVNAPIESTAGKLDVSLRAGRDIAVNATISTNGGSYSAAIQPSLLPAVEPEASEEETADSETVVTDQSVSEEESGATGETPEQSAQPSTIEVHDSGIKIEAGLNTDGGDINIDSGEQGLLSVNSAVSSSATDPEAASGNIHLLGDQISLGDSAVVNASGDTGGGEILIGGGQQGLDASVRNSTAVSIAESAQVSSDGTGTGNGGTLIVFAEDTALIRGNLSARGGELGGDGGFIETSGKQHLEVANAPDALASTGESGKWLIDPETITVANDDTSNTTQSADPSGSPVTFEPTFDGAVLNVGTVAEALLMGTDVEIVTTGDSNGAGNINWIASHDFEASKNPQDQGSTFIESGGLTLRAHNDINIEGFLYDSATSSGDNNNVAFLELHANSDGMNGGNVDIDANGHSGISTQSALEIISLGDITITGDNLFVSGGDESAAENVRVLAEERLLLTLEDTIEISSNGRFSSAEVSSFGTDSEINTENLTLLSSDGADRSSFRINGFSNTEKGTLNVTDTLTLNGGSLISRGTVTTNNLVWNVGRISGDFDPLVTTGQVTIDNKIIPVMGVQRALVLAKPWNIESSSIVNWLSGDIGVLDNSFGSASAGGIINNAGTFNALSDNNIRPLSSEVFAPLQFNNSGTFVKKDSTCNPDCGQTSFLSIEDFGAAAGAYFNNSGEVIVEKGTLNFQQAEYDVYPSGDIEIAGGFLQTGGSVSLQGGDIRASVIDLAGNVTDTGELIFDGGVLEGGTSPSVADGGTVIGNTILNAGALAAGQSPGTLQFNGDLTLNAGTSIEAELASTTSGDFDVINVAGTATLNNPDVNVIFFNGYQPTAIDGATDLFEIVNAATLTLTPDANNLNVNHPTLSSQVTPDSGRDGNTFFVAYTFSDDAPVTPAPEPVVTPTPTPLPMTPENEEVVVIQLPGITPPLRIPRTIIREITEAEPDPGNPYDPIAPVIMLASQTPELERIDESPNFFNAINKAVESDNPTFFPAIYSP